MADTDTSSIAQRDVEISLMDLPTFTNYPHEALVSKLLPAIRRTDAINCLHLFEQAQELAQSEHFVLSKKMTFLLLFLLTPSRHLELADVVLTSMEKNGIEQPSFIVRHYVELLCQVGEVDTATSVAEQR